MYAHMSTHTRTRGMALSAPQSFGWEMEHGKHGEEGSKQGEAFLEEKERGGEAGGATPPAWASITPRGRPTPCPHARALQQTGLGPACLAAGTSPEREKSESQVPGVRGPGIAQQRCYLSAVSLVSPHGAGQWGGPHQCVPPTPYWARVCVLSRNRGVIKTPPPPGALQPRLAWKPAPHILCAPGPRPSGLSHAPAAAREPSWSPRPQTGKRAVSGPVPGAGGSTQHPVPGPLAWETVELPVGLALKPRCGHGSLLPRVRLGPVAEPHGRTRGRAQLRVVVLEVRELHRRVFTTRP